MKEISEREVAAIWAKHGIRCGVDDDNGEFHITGFTFEGRNDADSVCHFAPLTRWATGVHFENSDVTAKGFAHFKGHPSLTDVFLDKLDLPGASYEILTTLPKLRNLGCSPRRETNVALSWIGQLTRLTKLRISESKVRDADLPALSHLGDLTDLDISTADVDSGLAIVTQFPKLSWLKLSSTKISTKTLESVGQAKTVTKLFLERVSIENDGLAAISHLDQLKVLGCRGDQIDAQGIVHLLKLPSLEDVYIDDLTITAEIVTIFRQITQLKRLWCLRSKFEPEVGIALKKALPECDVELFDEPK